MLRKNIFLKRAMTESYPIIHAFFAQNGDKYLLKISFGSYYERVFKYNKQM